MPRVTLGRLAAGLLALGLVLILAGAVLGGTGAAGSASGTGSAAGWGSLGFIGPGMMGGGMMGGNGIGQAMGSALAGRVGQPISQAQATALGAATPAGATVDQTAKRITFQTSDVRLAVLASPPDGPDMTFRIAGLVDPTIVVPVGATVTVQFVNADSDTSHAWLLTPAQPPFPFMAMMSTPPAFAGAFAPPLGDPTSAGLPSETLTFTAATAGAYTYLCPVPGHAQQGMYGTLQVTGA